MVVGDWLFLKSIYCVIIYGTSIEASRLCKQERCCVDKLLFTYLQELRDSWHYRQYCPPLSFSYGPLINVIWRGLILMFQFPFLGLKLGNPQHIYTHWCLYDLFGPPELEICAVRGSHWKTIKLSHVISARLVEEQLIGGSRCCCCCSLWRR